jgi:glycosyltransferase involved in cell wall biosynthesis
MATCVVIPTFWSRRGGRFSDRLINVYDHPTPIDGESRLGDCLRSLTDVRDIGKVVVLVATTDNSIEHEAEDRVREIVDTVPGLDTMVFGPAELGSLHRRLEQLEFSDMVSGVSLTGYGAVRNTGLIVAATLGAEVCVFVDDDEVISDPDFLRTGIEGLGMKTPDGKVLFAKTGYYVDAKGGHHLKDEAHWSDALWREVDEYNKAIGAVDAPPRVKPSSLGFGGCMALHRDMYCNVSFDPWVLRGEDVDYVINARMHGGDVFLDGEWHVVHQPPAGPSAALRFRQDVYRFIYEHRKLEFARSQIDLRRVSPASLRPYPGEFVGASVTWRALGTALLRALAGREPAAHLAIARAVLGDASRYARRNCDNYFAFQRRWPLAMERLWEDVALGSLFSGERQIDRTAITGRFPVIPSR